MNAPLIPGERAQPRDAGPITNARRRSRDARSAMVTGFTLGILLWSGARQLGADAVPVFRNDYLLLLAGIAGSVVGGTRWRPALWIAAGGVAVGIVLIAFTPVSFVLLGPLVVNDALQPADAVVVLSSDVRGSGALT